MKGKEGIQIQLEITEKALQKIKTISEKPVLLLWYDTDECGCGVNGLPTIRLAREIKESYMEVECSEMNVFVEKQQKVFFAEMYEIRLDWTSIPSCQSRTNNESVYPCQPDIHFVTSRLGYLIAMGFVNIRFRYPLDLFIYIFRQRAVDGKLDIFFYLDRRTCTKNSGGYCRVLQNIFYGKFV